MSGSYDHDGHGHDADAHAPIGHDDGDAEAWERRSAALQALLIEKGILTADEVRASIDDWESRTPTLGARLVGRAWVDPAFKARLLTDAKSAARELLGIDPGVPELVVLENTDRLHHVVVCTLCSCYPRGILGFPPAWYKSLTYRSRAIADPRGVLREFGLELPSDVEVRVVDSTADVRYLVLPKRPGGTDGLPEDQLAALVTRDSMIGVAEARQPVGA
jgi:nitrile hydratase subunit alpha